MKFKHHLSAMAALVLIAFSVACSSDEEYLLPSIPADNDNSAPQICTMILDGGIAHFDGTASRSAAGAGWAAGDTIYLMFGSVEGRAIYNAAEGNWTLHYYGSLSNTTSAVCKAYYFENAASVSETAVQLSPTTVPYGNTSATYSKSGSTITVKATLNPLTGRIRFKGTPGDSFELSGFNCYSSYTTNGASLSNAGISSTVTIGSDGYSPYYYGYFSGSTREINVTKGEYHFKTTCESNVLALGKTGYMNVPSTTMHNGWEKRIIYVDLGLPSGTLWATINVGAELPADYGDYFAWGETTTKTTYNWSTYKWCNGSSSIMTKYCTSSSYGTVDNKTQLEPSDDAATVNWGSNWCMPTETQQDELRNTSYTTWTWSTQTNSKGESVNGYRIVSKVNGNSLFLPAAGYRNNSSLYNAGSIRLLLEFVALFEQSEQRVLCVLLFE